MTLDFAKERLIENGAEVVAAFKDSASQLSDDSEALRLVEQLASDEAQTLESLKSL